ncbi:MAG: methyltransferase domain-containing protein [Actinomycetota bacterium]
MTDLWPENPRLAEVYDVECAGRWDHDFYLSVASEVDAQSVLDIGCGTGVFCVDVAAAGRRAIGVDPAQPMIDIARSRSGGDACEWIVGDAGDAPADTADLVVMMGHVAQYFVDDDHWARTLSQIHRALVPGGRVTFESRNPMIDWASQWTEANSRGTLDHPRGGTFEAWVQVVDTAGPRHSYASTHEGHTILPDGDHLVSRETLRFRSQAEIEASLASAGFTIEQRWGNWRREPLTPESREMIFLARRD